MSSKNKRPADPASHPHKRPKHPGGAAHAMRADMSHKPQWFPFPLELDAEEGDTLIRWGTQYLLNQKVTDIQHITREAGRTEVFLDSFISKTISSSSRVQDDAQKSGTVAAVEIMKKVSRQLLANIASTHPGIDPGRLRVLASIMAVDAGAGAQTNHMDNPNGIYFTAMIPLTAHKDQGGTVFTSGKKHKKDDPVDIPPGSPARLGYYFAGNQYHYGGANRSNGVRVVLALIATNGLDKHNRHDRVCPLIEIEQGGEKKKKSRPFPRRRPRRTGTESAPAV